MNEPSYHKLFALGAGVVAAAAIVAGCRATPAPSAPPASAPAATATSENVWAVVDGRQITRDDVEKAFRRLQTGGQPASDEEALAAKLSVLDDYIVQDILLAKARSLKVEVSDAELTNAYAEGKKSMNEQTFQQELNRRALTEADMREGLRREMVVRKLLDQEVTGKVAVTAQEVSDFFMANRARLDLKEDAYHIGQIVVTPVREQTITNRTGSDAINEDTAAVKVNMLMERLKQGQSFADLARDYSEDPQTAQVGGDLGLVPMSQLKQAPQPLRDAVLKKTPGTVSIASVNGVHTLVLVVAHAPAGQRDLSTPGVSDQITQELRSRKEQLMRTAYLMSARDDANVVNYLARRVVDLKGDAPAGSATPVVSAPAPSAPAAVAAAPSAAPAKK
jgi:parvulin-like peptidyl-prolyl isomerase